MITRFRVKGFKSLADFEIELGHVNVLIGANGSGKTNILEAIAALGAAAQGAIDDQALRSRGARLSGPGRYATRLSGAGMRSSIGLAAEWGSEGEREHVRYEVGLQPPPEADGKRWEYGAERAWEQGRLILDRSRAANGTLNPQAGWAALKSVEMSRDSPAWSLLLSLQEYAVYAPNTPTLRGEVPDAQQRVPVGLSGGGLAEAAARLQLHSGSSELDEGGYYGRVCADVAALVDWATAFGVGARSARVLAPGVPSGQLVLYFEDRFMESDWRRLGAYEASEGALYVVLAAVLAADPIAPWCFAIDDFDHSLNPRLARGLVQRFCGWVLDDPRSRQVLLTTHNPLVLDGLDLTDDRIRLFAVDRTVKGRTVARRVVVDQELMKKSEGEWPLSRLWVRGEIGGMPRV